MNMQINTESIFILNRLFKIGATIVFIYNIELIKKLHKVQMSHKIMKIQKLY